MNQINSLLRRARRAASPAIHSAFCIVDFDETINKWTAVPQLWDGVPGSGVADTLIPSDWKREYDTAEEAAEAVDRFCATLDIADQDRIVILIDDVGV